jgi:hypothetical protein
MEGAILGENDRRRVRSFANLSKDLESAGLALELHVAQHHGRIELAGKAERLLHVTGDPNDVDVGLPIEEGGQTRRGRRVIIDHKKADHPGHRRSTIVPPPGRAPIWMMAPIAAARPRMSVRPRWPVDSAQLDRGVALYPACHRGSRWSDVIPRRSPGVIPRLASAPTGSIVVVSRRVPRVPDTRRPEMETRNARHRREAHRRSHHGRTNHRFDADVDTRC